ncbi:MAG: hypothetical protein ACI4WS_13205 [Oscillospiraceae bacterium]
MKFRNIVSGLMAAVMLAVTPVTALAQNTEQPTGTENTSDVQPDVYITTEHAPDCTSVVFCVPQEKYELFCSTLETNGSAALDMQAWFGDFSQERDEDVELPMAAYHVEMSITGRLDDVDNVLVEAFVEDCGFDMMPEVQCRKTENGSWEVAVSFPDSLGIAKGAQAAESLRLRYSIQSKGKYIDGSWDYYTKYLTEQPQDMPELDFSKPSVCVSTDCYEGCTSIIFTIPAEKAELFKKLEAENAKSSMRMQADFQYGCWAWFTFREPQSCDLRAFEDDCDADGAYTTLVDYTENGDIVGVLSGSNDLPFSEGVRASKSVTVTFYITQSGKVVDGSKDGVTVSLTGDPLTDISTLSFGKIPTKSYTGKELTPSIVIKDGDKKLTYGWKNDYTVSYENNKDIGTATVTITGRGDYTGIKKLTFRIVPKKTNLSVKFGKTSGGWKRATLSWKKSLGADGWEVQYSENGGKFTKFVTVKGDKLSARLKYPEGAAEKFRVRPFAEVNGKKVYGAWSNIVTLK